MIMGQIIDKHIEVIEYWGLDYVLTKIRQTNIIH